MTYSENVLVIDDEKEVALATKLTIMACGFLNVETISDSRKVMEYLRKNCVDIITLDLTMPFLSGEELLPQIKTEFPQISIMIISGIMDVDVVIQCMRNGAKDYLIKPINDDRLCTTINNIAIELRLRSENTLLRKKFISANIENHSAFSKIITKSKVMHNIFSYVEAIANTPLPILITGETGSGKELMAKAIHNTRHPDAPFIACNIAGIDDIAFSDTLFGHTKGAFTGAISSRNGMIEKAQGGTLFLDEIGELSGESQVKLLRLIQEGEYFPLGADVPEKSDAWIVVATNRSLEDEKLFRRDLYFRLNAHEITLPPLRNRTEDIAVLVSHFVSKYKPELSANEVVLLAGEIERQIVNREFLGNIRELEGVVANMALIGVAPLTSVEVNSSSNKKQIDEGINLIFNSFPTMDEIKANAVEKAIEHCDGNKTSASRLLGVSKQTIFTLSK
jgi:DNA-binding NtrC family response regulator